MKDRGRCRGFKTWAHDGADPGAGALDLHSANQFNFRHAFTTGAMLHMENFPFISRLWFGEFFEYYLGEDYWLTEVSALPFSLMGEMLPDGGHPQPGMLYGMTGGIS